MRYGSRALLIECADLSQVSVLHAELLRRRAEGGLPSVEDIVPAERTVLIDGIADPAHLADLATALPAWSLSDASRLELRFPSGPTVHLPVHYTGPDIRAVAEAWNVPEPEVGAIHSAYEYTVAFCGFAPGFAYLAGLPERYQVPRRPTPRTSVPSGSVAVAGPYTGVYPRELPGGWQLIGTTDADLWDLARDEPALLTPGTGVRFIPAGA